MMPRPIHLLAVAAILAFGANHLSAAIIQADFASPGDNLLVHDTGTGLDWLRITATTNISYNTLVSTQLATGGIYEGFAHASQSQINTLFTNAGIDVIGGNDPSNADGIGLLIALFGYTNLNAFSASTQGIYALSNTAGSHETAFIQQGQQPPGPAFNFAFAPAVGNNISDGSAVLNVGHWLVRSQDVEEVPEPSTLVLAGMAVANLLVLRRRRAT